MKNYSSVKLFSPKYIALVSFLAGIFWATTCMSATVKPHIPTLRYMGQNDSAGQNGFKILLPIENEEPLESLPSAKKDGSTALSLGLQDAIRYAVKNNKDIQYYSYNPPQAKESLAIASSVYDASIFQSGSYNSTERPIESIIDQGSSQDVLEEDRWNMQIGVKKPLFTGGMFSLFVESNYLDSTSDYVLPNPQYTSRLTAQVRQSLLKEIGDRTNKATIKIASINLERSKEDFRTEVSSVLEKVINTYWQLFYDLHYKEIRQESLAMAEEVYRWEKTRREQGIANPVDVDQAEAAVETRRIALDQAGNQIKATLRQLHQIMGFPFVDSPGNTLDFIPTDPPRMEIIQVSESDTLSKALDSRPEIIAARKAAEAAETKQKLAKHLRLPKLDAKASYTLNSLDKNFDNSADELFFSDKDTWVVALEFEYPLGNNKASAEYRKSVLEYRQAQREIAKTEEMIRLDVELAVKDVSFYGNKVVSTGKVEKTLESVVEGKKTRFEISQIDNDELLYAQNLLTDAKVENLQAIVGYNLKLAGLSKAQGTLLDDLGISLE